MNTGKLYSRISTFYDFGLSLIGYKRAVDCFVATLPFSKNDPIKVLDAGCGTGLYSLALLRRYPNAQVVAFDINAEMVNKMRLNLARQTLGSRARVFRANIQGPLKELEGQTFDLIVTGGVLEYVPIEDAVKNLSRFLVQDGYFLNSPAKDNFSGRVIGKPCGFKPYSKERNISAFAQSDFTFVNKFDLLWRIPIALKEAHLFQKQKQ